MSPVPVTPRWFALLALGLSACSSSQKSSSPAPDSHGASDAKPTSPAAVQADFKRCVNTHLDDGSWPHINAELRGSSPGEIPDGTPQEKRCASGEQDSCIAAAEVYLGRNERGPHVMALYRHAADAAFAALPRSATGKATSPIDGKSALDAFRRHWFQDILPGIRAANPLAKEVEDCMAGDLHYLVDRVEPITAFREAFLTRKFQEDAGKRASAPTSSPVLFGALENLNAPDPVWAVYYAGQLPGRSSFGGFKGWVSSNGTLLLVIEVTEG